MDIETVPRSSYLENLIESMRENGYEHEQLVKLLFGIIDEFCD